MLTNQVITFGKYRGNNISQVLRDRKYCEWLLTQEWFRENYEYLFNRVNEYKPIIYFLREDDNFEDFLSDYKYFNLTKPDKLEIELNTCDKLCYEYYLRVINNLKNRILERLENDEENAFDIKAPTHWLKIFEEDYGIPREDFKDFLHAYELPNIPYIIEDIKKQGGIEYKGAKSFKIAKQRSVEQEEWWSIILREKYGENLGTQFKYEQCIFDMIVIEKKIIFECKLGLKDFDDIQYNKYKKALKEYKIIYLVGYDAVVVMEEKTIYTKECDKYNNYILSIASKASLTKFDLILIDFIVKEMDVYEIFKNNFCYNL